MDDPKLVAQSKTAVLRAMQQFALEQSVEESVKVTSEPESAGRQTCTSCGSANRKGNSFCANCGVPLQKAPEGAESASPVDPKPVPKAESTRRPSLPSSLSPPAISSSAGGMELQRPVPMCGPTGGGGGAGRDIARVRARSAERR